MTATLLPLGSVADFIRGITFRPDDLVPPDADATVACFRTSNVQEDIELEDVWYLPRSFARRPDLFLREGDILISTANSWNLVGKCAWVPSLQYDAVPGGFIAAIRTDETKASPRYLFHWLRLPQTQNSLRNCANKTTNISNLSIERCLTLKLPLPPLDEQHRIATILDQVDDLRRKRRLALEKLNALPQAIFQEMFGDLFLRGSFSRLDSLIDEDDRINYGVVQPGSESPEGVPLVRVANIVTNNFKLESLKRISRAIESKYKRSRLRGSEVLVACVGSIGSVSLVTPDLAGMNIARAVARVPVDPKKANRIFIAAFLRLPQTQRYFVSETRTVAQPTLNIKQLAETLILDAPRDLQDVFAQRLRASDTIIAHCENSLNKMDALCASLQHHAFAGTLTSAPIEATLSAVR